MKGDRFADLVGLVDRLRGPDGCPWDREQSFETLKPMILEEAYEVLEALDTGRREEVCTELGDLLFQVVFLARMAEEEGTFDIDSVAERIISKMVRRHPHVFGNTKASSSEEVLRNWETIKAAERKQQSDTTAPQSSETSILEGVPRMSALLTANKLTSKAARVGFDWSHVDEIILKLHEEIEELRNALEGGQAEPVDPAVEQEVGDLLFATVNIARFLKIDPESALRKANRKFTERFRYIEQTLRKLGKDIKQSNLEEMERLWQEAKGSI